MTVCSRIDTDSDHPRTKREIGVEADSPEEHLLDEDMLAVESAIARACAFWASRTSASPLAPDLVDLCSCTRMTGVKTSKLRQIISRKKGSKRPFFYNQK